MSTALKWDDFPWPVFKHPSGPDDVTTLGNGPSARLTKILYEFSCSPQDLRTRLSSQDMRYSHDSAEVGYYGYLNLFIRISRMMLIGGSMMSAEVGRGRRKPSRRRSSSGARRRKQNARRSRNVSAISLPTDKSSSGSTSTIRPAEAPPEQQFRQEQVRLEQVRLSTTFEGQKDLEQAVLS
ncbi:hypothetical protein M405DRAFT_400990 [Rhizopogon salebrosus TDB-379]|nr:hypothetical protein M405DRAFT_400990 [Rhizopogon salebrosus TDB-379]